MMAFSNGHKLLYRFARPVQICMIQCADRKNIKQSVTQVNHTLFDES